MSASAVVGVAMDRARTAITIILRDHASRAANESVFRLEKPRSMTKLFAVKKSDVFTDAEYFSQKLILTYSDTTSGSGVSLIPAAAGILETPMPGPDSSVSSIELLKLQTVVEYELRRGLQQPIITQSIASVRRSLGMTGTKGAEGKKRLLELFKSSGTDFSECSSGSGYQTMAESWGVAQLLDKQNLITSFRQANPEVIETIRDDIRRRRVFRDSNTVKKEILDDLVNTEVNKVLLKRLSLS